MKNKADLTLEIMKRVMSYEKKKLHLWYEVVIFVLTAILAAEILVAFDLLIDIQESPSMNFMWVLGEDVETIRILSGSILKIMWGEMPWMKVSTLSVVTISLVGCLIYVIKRNGFKRIKAKEIRKYEKTET